VPAISPGLIETMASLSTKPATLQVVFYQRVPATDTSWCDKSDWQKVGEQLAALVAELKGLNINLEYSDETTPMVVRGYADILNSIRLRFPAGGFSNTCLGHIIGNSSNLNIAEDLKRGINRILFAPETIEPLGSDKVVCHNCGCGC
jgi:hypothetical protein